MSKFQLDVMLKIVKIIDLVMITIPCALCWELYYSYQVYAKFGWKGNWAMIGLFAVPVSYTHLRYKGSCPH